MTFTGGANTINTNTAGTGAVTITSALTFTGTAAITNTASGTGVTTLSTGAMVMAGAATFTNTGSGSMVISNVVSNASTLTFTDGSSGALTASGATTFSSASNAINTNTTSTGAVTISSALTFAGTAAITNTNSGAGVTTFSTGAVILAGATTFTNNGSGTLTVSNAVTAGGNSLTFAGNSSGNTTLSGAISFTTPVSITNSTTGTGITTVGAGAMTLSGPTSLTVTNTNTNAGATLILSGAITAGLSPITISGAGNTTIAGAITFAAPSTITVAAGAGATTLSGLLTTGPGFTTVTNNSANTLTMGAITSAANPLVFAGSGAISVNGVLSVNNYVGYTGSGGLTLNALTFNAATFLTFNNTGTATMTVAAPINMSSGSDNIQVVGTTAVQFTGAIINTTTATTITVQSSANTLFSGQNTWGNNNEDFANFGSGLVTFSGTQVNQFALIIGGNGNFAFTGNIIGAGGVTLAATDGATAAMTGTTTLSGNNTFNGIISIGAGVVSVSSSNNLGASTLATAITLGGGTLQVTGNVTQPTTAGISVTAAGSLAVPSINLSTSGITLTTGTDGLSLGASIVVTGAASNFIVNGPTTLTAAATITNTLAGGGGITLSGNVSGAFALTVAGTGSTTINGIIASNIASLTINGIPTSSAGGTTTLTAASNAYTGATTVNYGTLVGAAQASGANTLFGFGSAVTVNSGTLELAPAVAGGTTTTIASLTTGGNATVSIVPNGVTTLATAGALGRSGTGTVVFNSAQSLGINANFTFGTLAPVNGILAPWAVVQNGAGTSADFLNANAGALAVASYAGGALPTSVGSSSLVYTSNGTVLSAGTAAYAVQVNGGNTISGAATLTLGNGVNQAGLILNSGSGITATTLAFGAAEGVVYANGASTISSAITGTAGLTIFGGGTVTLSGNNTSLTGGALTINGSTLVVTAITNLNIGGAAGAMTLAAGTLNIGGVGGIAAAFNTSEAITVGFGGGIIAVNNSALTTISGALKSNTTTGPLTITPTAVSNVVFSGVVTGLANNNITISGAGNVSFTNQVTVSTMNMNGTGMLTITPTTASTEVVIVNSGTVVLNAGAAIAAAASVTINNGLVQFGTSGQQTTSGLTINGGTLDLNGTSSSIGGTAGATFNGNGGTVTNNTKATPATLTLNLTSAAAATNVLYAGNINDGAGQVALTINTGTNQSLILAGNNTFSGVTTIAAANVTSVKIGSNNAFQNSTVNILQTNNTVGLTQQINFNQYNPTAIVLGGLSGYGQVSIVSGPVTLSIGNNNSSTNFSGIIATGNASEFYLNKIGTGTLALGGINTFAGNTIVSAGSLQTIVPFALPVATNLLVNGGTFDMYSLNQTVATLGGSAAVNTGASLSTAGSLTTAAFNLTNLNISSVYTQVFSGVISGGGGVVKTAGANNVILTGANTYTGNTIVNVGTLQLSFVAQPSGSNILAGTNNVFLGGGTLNITASDAAASTSSQTLASLATNANTAGTLTLANSVGSTTLNVTLGGTLLRSGSSLVINMPSLGTNTLNVGAITGLNSIVNLTLPATIGSSTSTVTTTSATGNGALITNQNGTAYVVIGGAGWGSCRYQWPDLHDRQRHLHGRRRRVHHDGT